MIPEKETHVNPLPTIETLLERHRLPSPLAHLESIIRQLPDTECLIDTILGCVNAGFDDDQISDALAQVAMHVQQPVKRCACCLAWRSGGHTFARADSGNLELVTVCATCGRAIEAGRITPTMRRNLHTYGFGGAA